jgi:hypothetical protein
MYLVHQKKAMDGKWEVAWTWLPYFIAADRGLHDEVDAAMTDEFKGTMLEDEQNAVLKMHNRVIELILRKYNMPGLRAYLESIIHLHPEEEPT